MKTLTMTCSKCHRQETFTGYRGSDLIIALDASTWSTVSNADATGTVDTCGTCSGHTVPRGQRLATAKTMRQIADAL